MRGADAVDVDEESERLVESGITMDTTELADAVKAEADAGEGYRARLLKYKKSENDGFACADKTAAWLASFGVFPDGVFVSPAHARGQSFRGFPVCTPDEALARWGNPLILLCFASSRPDVIAGIETLARRAELLIPDFPVADETLFDLPFAHPAP